MLLSSVFHPSSPDEIIDFPIDLLNVNKRLFGPEYCHSFVTLLASNFTYPWLITLVNVDVPSDPFVKVTHWTDNIFLTGHRITHNAYPLASVHISVRMDTPLWDGGIQQSFFFPDLDHTNSQFVARIWPSWSQNLNIPAVVFYSTQVTSIHLNIDYRLSTPLLRPLTSFPVPFDVFVQMCHNLDLISLQRVLTHTHPSIKQDFSTFSSIKHRINRYILPYFNDNMETFNAMRTCMRRTGSLISGSSALALLTGSLWIPGDLDVVVRSSSYNHLHEFVVSIGYVEIDDTRHPHPPFPSLALNDQTDNTDTYPTIFRSVKYRNGSLLLDISICQDILSPLHHIMSYHSSAVMNFISHDSLVSLFPTFTSRNLNLFNTLPHGHTNRRLMEKYRHRGFEPVIREGRMVGIGHCLSLARSDCFTLQDLHLWNHPLMRS